MVACGSGDVGEHAADVIILLLNNGRARRKASSLVCGLPLPLQVSFKERPSTGIQKVKRAGVGVR